MFTKLFYMLGTICLIVSLSSLSFLGCRAHVDRSSNNSADHQEDGKLTSLDPADKLPKMIVKDFTLSGVDENTGGGVSARFCTELSNTSKLEVLCAQDVNQLLQYQQDLINFGACDEENCLVKMGEKLQARFVIQGTIHKVGDEYLMQASLIDSQLGKIVRRFSEKASSGDLDDLLDATSNLAKNIISVF